MARVPTIAEEDAKRPNRERDSLVGERTRIVNRIKSTLAPLGIRNFKPTLRKAAERLPTVHTPEGMPLPPNTLAELQRDIARLGFCCQPDQRDRGSSPETVRAAERD
jgi:transposase